MAKAEEDLARKLLQAFELLNSNKEAYKLVPEVRMNLVYALPEAKSVEEVAGFPGRITFDGEGLAFVKPPRLGASRHVANAVLTAMKYDKSVRSAMNLRYDEELIRRAEEAGFKVSFFDRSKEPEEVRAVEGRTTSWGVEEAIRSAGGVPDLIYHLGGVGKEPMILILGKDPVDVVEKLFKLIGRGPESSGGS